MMPSPDFLNFTQFNSLLTTEDYMTKLNQILIAPALLLTLSNAQASGNIDICLASKVATCMVRKTHAEQDCKTRERRSECNAECRVEAFEQCGSPTEATEEGQ